MKTEIYECDRCHKKAITSDEVYTLDLRAVKLEIISSVNLREKFTWSAEWCRACRTQIGVEELDKREGKPQVQIPVEPQPSLEDMVREIVRQELPNS